jgi:nucleoid DNA-binding protein
MKDPNRLCSLLAKKLAGEATEEELQDLQDLLQKNQDMHFPIQVLSGLWDQPQRDPGSNPETEKAFKRIAERLAKRRAGDALKKRAAELLTRENPPEKQSYFILL